MGTSGIKVLRDVFAVAFLTGVLSGTSSGSPTAGYPDCRRVTSSSRLFPHPTDCTKFIECWGVQRTVKDCPPGTAFSRLIETCDHIHSVPECGISSYSISSYSICKGVKDYECGRASLPSEYVRTSSRLDIETAKSFPWHAAIYRKKMDKFQHACGAALIQPNLVLTAAHCLYNNQPKPQFEGSKTDYRVAVGKVYKEWDHAESSVHLRNVSQVWKGQKFMGSEADWQSDFALVKLDSPVECVTPVCVDWNDQYHSFDTPDGTLVAWGGIVHPHHGRALHQTSITPLKFADCMASCPRLAPHVGEKNICAKGTTTGEPLREGDSGEVLMFMINGRKFARGIVSTDFDENSRCTVYTSVKNYIKELKKMVSKAENQ